MIDKAEVQELQSKIDLTINAGISVGELSDGYHTFNELYEFRKVYNATLFNEWGKDSTLIGGWVYRVTEDNPKGKIEIPKAKYDVHKSWKHSDGELCFGGGWFIVSAMLPTGLISNHYEAKDWDLFKIPEEPIAKYEYDGHTAEDVLKRLKSI